MYDADIHLKYVLFVEHVMLPIVMGHHMVKQIAYIYINILYVEHYIYNNEEYYIYMSRTYKVTYNHGKVQGETNLIQVIMKPYIHNNVELYICWGHIYIFVIYIYCMFNV